MIERETTGLDFEALRHAIEERELDLVLVFYADDAEVIIVNAEAPFSPPFELVGKAEIAKYLRAVFSQKTSHRIEGEVVGEEMVEYLEACEYPDGTRVWVATALEVEGGRIFRQVEVVSRDGDEPARRESRVKGGERM